MAYAESLKINISIATMCRLTARVLDVSNAFHNTNVPFNERLCVSAQSCYLDWFEIFTPMFLSIDIMVHFLFSA